MGVWICVLCGSSAPAAFLQGQGRHVGTKKQCSPSPLPSLVEKCSPGPLSPEQSFYELLIKKSNISSKMI